MRGDATSGRDRRRDWAIGAALVAVTIAVYLPVLSAGFIWDDDFYVTHNPTLRSAAGLRDIWLTPQATPQYYPLTHTSFWIEYRLWALRPAGYHLVNVLLHGISAVLLWRILRALDLPGAWIGAVWFAVHPIQVESVAWITERKNILSGAFALAAVLVYLRAPSRRWLLYGLFACALLSKTVTATVPLCLAGLSWWKEGGLTRRRAAVLAPMVVAGGAMGLLTAWIEKHHVGAEGIDWSLALAERFALAGRIFWFYLGKLAWPVGLNFVYPRWNVPGWGLAGLLFPLSVALLFAALWVLRERLGRGPLVAAAIYLVTLAPALGFIDVYPMRFSFVADHFQYLAGIAPLALAGALLGRAGARHERGGSAGSAWWSRAAGWLPAAAVAALCFAPLTWAHVRDFHDEETLWRATLSRNPDAWIAWENLGNILARRGDPVEAIRCYGQTLRLQPQRAETYHNLGLAHEARKDWPAAEAAYRTALELRPGLRDARNNLAIVLYFEGRYAESWAEVRELRRQGGTPHPDFLRNLAARMPEP